MINKLDFLKRDCITGNHMKLDFIHEINVISLCLGHLRTAN